MSETKVEETKFEFKAEVKQLTRYFSSLALYSQRNIFT